MGTELTTQNTALATDMDAIDALAKSAAVAESGSGIEQSTALNVMRIVIGRGMGIDPGNALSGIHIVKGKPVLSGPLMAGLIDRSAEYDFIPLETNATVCRLEFFKNGVSRGVSSFSMDDAKRANLGSSTVWKSYPDTMLYWRAMGLGFRKFCGGLAMGEVYIEGEIPEDTPAPIPRNVTPETVDITPPKSDMDLLMDKLAICSGILQGPENTNAQKEEKRRAHKDLLDIQKDQLEAPESARLSPKRMARLEELIDIQVPA